MRNNVPVSSKRHARAMRAEPTEAESALWRLLRDRKLQGIKWRRQVPIGVYIVDLVSFERRLVVECDGSQHAERRHDVSRDDWLRQQGFSVLRFWNHEVLQQRESVLNTILARCGLPW